VCPETRRAQEKQEWNTARANANKMGRIEAFELSLQADYLKLSREVRSPFAKGVTDWFDVEDDVVELVDPEDEEEWMSRRRAERWRRWRS
jgi:hypothetical protein